MRINQYEKRSDGQAHLIVAEYWANDTSMTIFPEWMKDPVPIDFVGGLGLDKPGGVMNAASPPGNVKLMPMNGKQSLLLRSHV